MSPKAESQPFLYSDDPTPKESPEIADHSFLAPQRQKRLVTHFGVAVGTSLLWILVLFFCNATPASPYTTPPASQQDITPPPTRHNITSGARLLQCGSTPQEAQSNGCRYDILLNNWVPAPCYDQEWVDEYADDVSWAAYADAGMKERLNVDQMSEVDHYYTSTRDHVNHCAMMWKKQFYVLYEGRKAFDTVIASPGHTDHCATYLMESAEAKYTEPTMVQMGFAGCWVRD